MGRTLFITSAVTALTGTIGLLAVPDGRTTVARLCTHAGLCDQSVRTPEVIDLIVDMSDGSHIPREHLEQTLDVVLPWIGTAPGSALRVIVQGSQAMDAIVAASVVSTTPARTNARARDAHVRRFIATARERIAEAMEPIFARSSPLRHSPIVETIGWVTLLSPPLGVAPGTARRIITITDARQVSKAFGDFECGTLPTPKEFVERLRTHGVFTSTSLNGIPLHFTFTELKSVDRKECPPMTIARSRDIQALWTAAALYAGAPEITFATGAITLRQHHDEEEHPS